jgi:hypothetical protein
MKEPRDEWFPRLIDYANMLAGMITLRTFGDWEFLLNLASQVWDPELVSMLDNRCPLGFELEDPQDRIRKSVRLINSFSGSCGNDGMEMYLSMTAAEAWKWTPKEESRTLRRPKRWTLVLWWRKPQADVGKTKIWKLRATIAGELIQQHNDGPMKCTP